MIGSKFSLVVASSSHRRHPLSSLRRDSVQAGARDDASDCGGRAQSGFWRSSLGPVTLKATQYGASLKDRIIKTLIPNHK
eukprot:588162-Hanusia_phi.AAC.1